MTNKISNHNFVKHVNFYAPSSSYIHAMNPLVLHHALHHLVLSPLLFLLVVTSSLSHGEFSFKTKSAYYFHGSRWCPQLWASKNAQRAAEALNRLWLSPCFAPSPATSFHHFSALTWWHKTSSQSAKCCESQSTTAGLFSSQPSVSLFTWSKSETLPPFISMHCIALWK